MAQWSDPVEGGVEFPPPHLGLTWRRAQVSDLERMLALAAQATTGVNHIRCEPMMLARLARMNVLPEYSDVIAGFDSEGVMQAFASVIVNHLNTPIVRAQVEGVISRNWRQKGVGRAVLDWQDGRARQLAMTVPGATGIQIDSLAEGENSELRRLLAAGGFTPAEARTFYLANVSQLAQVGREALDTLRAEGFQARPLAAKDLAQLQEMNNSTTSRSSFLKPAGDEDWRLLIGMINADASIVIADSRGVVAYDLLEEGRRGAGLVRARGVREGAPELVARHMFAAHVGLVASRFTELRILAGDDDPIVDSLLADGFSPDGTLIRYSIEI
ncbi:hypothetical protein J2S49_000239 [Arcanobacterium wilhelmae]|uniref:N-acetyltransferase domain-containing protein n=1 Tax=Arcanobacterium wilhelmae TaxID=1803177 RepID=A0ABT9N9F3_9ACTO|nr:hypothetical protein [Arcanobacterium wilhelmae]MDP9800163.1 hypothetical protein [Arcanobacterium wilhelmae]